MKQNRLLVSAGLILFRLFIARAETVAANLTAGIDVSMTNRPDIVQWRAMRAKIQAQMPYLNNHYWNHHTLTALCARRWICCGNILTVTSLGFSYPNRMTGTAEMSSNSYTGEKKQLAVAIDESLQGGLQGKINVIVNYRDTECLYMQKTDWNNLAAHQKFIFFLSDTTTGAGDPSPIYIIQWEAMLSLEKDPDAMIATVKEALPAFRDPWKNMEVYYTLLRKHCQSPLARIREDANRSLQIFSMFCPSNLLSRILADPMVHPVQKEYIKEIVVPARTKNLKQEPTNQRERGTGR